MNAKTLLFHVFRLALAAGLLWLDTRVFLFYAFTILLLLLHHLNILRATLRVGHALSDVRSSLILKRLGVSDEEWRSAVSDYRNVFDELDARFMKSLDDDVRLASKNAPVQFGGF